MDSGLCLAGCHKFSSGLLMSHVLYARVLSYHWEDVIQLHIVHLLNIFCFVEFVRVIALYLTNLPIFYLIYSL